jgi:hypothetical protein
MIPGPIRRPISLAIAILVLLVVLLVAPSSPKGTHFTSSVVDVSWPNCHQTTVSSETGIIGVTGGLDFRPNPCLSEEPSWFSHIALYMNTGYPGIVRARKFINTPQHCGRNSSLCLAYNYGYNASRYAINYANQSGAHSNIWWLDVETENSWSNSIAVNRAVLQGNIDALRQTIPFVQVGIYSSPLQWQQLVSRWHNHVPSWVATGALGSQGVKAAITACRQPSFTGGTNWLAQYTPSLDVDYACNNLLAEHLYLPGI